MINLTLDIITLLGMVVLLWDKFRASRLTARLNGKPFVVPNDEVKNAFKRTALGELSKVFHGARVNHTSEWNKNTLVIETKD